MSDAGWAVPGVRLPRPAADDVPALRRAVDDVLAADPAGLAGPVALERARELLEVQERLHAAALTAVADVDARELWQHAATGSTRTWLRTLPCGDRGQLLDARALAGAPLLAAALADGLVALRTATTAARQLARLPEHVPSEQLHAALVDGTGQLLVVWTGGGCLEPTGQQEAEFAARRDRRDQAVQAGLAATCWGSPAQALEPVAVLLAQVLAPAEAEAGLALLVDALQPEPDLDAVAEQEYRGRDLLLRRLKGGGWSLRGHLTDETGQLLHDELRARDRHPARQRDETDPVAEAHRLFSDDDHDASAQQGPDAEQGREQEPQPGPEPGPEPQHLTDGTAGSGLPPLTTGARTPGSVPVEGAPLPSAGQRAHDALAALLQDLSGIPPGSGRPSPASLTVVATLAAVSGQPGAPPALLRTPSGDVPLTPASLRRHGCDAMLSAVLLEAHGQPVGASGEHRHATPRERRTLHATWGSRCGVNGCDLPWTVPHHVEPFSTSRRTRQADLVGVCQHHHHDVHDGRKTLRLRDGRLIDERGWVDAAWHQHRAG